MDKSKNPSKLKTQVSQRVIFELNIASLNLLLTKLSSDFWNGMKNEQRFVRACSITYLMLLSSEDDSGAEPEF